MYRYEGLVLSVGGNGRSYILILEAGPSADTSQSKLYFSRFNTKAGFCRVRISFLISVSFVEWLQYMLSLILLPCNWQVRVPFSSFRPVKPDDPPLDPFLVHTLTIRFEPRRQVCTFLLSVCEISRRICFICFPQIQKQCKLFFSVCSMNTFLCIFAESTYYFFAQKAVEGRTGVQQQDPRSFTLILEYIKALPVSL